LAKRKPQGKRVHFRQNRLRPARRKQWDLAADQADAQVEDATTWETVRHKGALSRKRTISEGEAVSAAADRSRFVRGTAIAVRGQFVEVDDGTVTWLCSVRRILRTRLIQERHPVVAGDEVLFSPMPDSTVREGVVEEVLPRRSMLHRSDGRRFHVIAANVDQVVIISSIREPMIKEHLIDRYLVAVHAGGPQAVVCINKADLAEAGEVDEILDRYRRVGYPVLATSVPSGAGIDELRARLKDRVTMVAGQSGVGKSSLINAVQPGLNLKTAHVSITTEKGRHTTTTAAWYRLDMGGAIIDTPGIRALDVAMVPLNELEMHFVEFAELIPLCKFPDCVHIHEEGCAVKAAVEAGVIDISRYESYVELFMERSEQQRR
jgi:ribosome biogenesis GTPase